MKTLQGAIATLFAAILSAALCLGQAPAARKSYTFHGKVVAVNQDTQRLTVDGEKVDGWMRAMTMNYKVDNPSIFAKLQPGDRITATVYDGDLVLHDVTAGGPAPARKSYAFHGKVVAVNKGTQRLTVDGEKVDGWMRAMTMNYQVDNPALFDKLKPGDRISATVYDGDLVLHYVAAASGPANGQVANKPPTIVFHRYRVPQNRLGAFLSAQRYGVCHNMMLNFVDCEGPATGDFGQVELDSNNKPFVNGRPVPPPSYPIPATPPPAGVAPAQQAQADQIWNRAVDLLDSNPKDAMPLLYQCALMGDKRCEATMGIRFQDGDVIKADDHAAAYWFGLAVAQGHRASQYALAGMYQEGEGGLPHDDAKATELLIKSANQGYFKAQYALAFQYEIGDGVPRSRQKAIELFRASGDGIAIADALADPNAPASFKDMIAFARYLSSLRNAEEAASWQAWLDTLPKGGGGCAPSDVGCIMHGSAMSAWRSAGGIDSGKPHP